MAQHTYEIETTEGLDILVIEDYENVEEVFERYKNDEAGEYLKKQNAKLLSYELINSI